MYFIFSLRWVLTPLNDSVGQCIQDATHHLLYTEMLCSVLLRLLLRGRRGDHGNDTRLLVFLPRTALARPIAEEDLLAATALVQRVRGPARKARACAAARSAHRRIGSDGHSQRRLRGRAVHQRQSRLHGAR